MVSLQIFLFFFIVLLPDKVFFFPSIFDLILSPLPAQVIWVPIYTWQNNFIFVL